LGAGVWVESSKKIPSLSPQRKIGIQFLLLKNFGARSFFYFIVFVFYFFWGGAFSKKKEILKKTSCF